MIAIKEVSINVKFPRMSGWHHGMFTSRKTTILFSLEELIVILLNSASITFQKLQRTNKLSSQRYKLLRGAYNHHTPLSPAVFSQGSVLTKFVLILG